MLYSGDGGGLYKAQVPVDDTALGKDLLQQRVGTNGNDMMSESLQYPALVILKEEFLLSVECVDHVVPPDAWPTALFHYGECCLVLHIYRLVLATLPRGQMFMR